MAKTNKSTKNKKTTKQEMTTTNMVCIVLMVILIALLIKSIRKKKKNLDHFQDTKLKLQKNPNDNSMYTMFNQLEQLDTDLNADYLG